MVGEKKIEPPCLSRLSCRCVYLSLSHHVSLFLSPSLLSVFLSFSLSHHVFFSLSPHSCLYYYFSLSPKSCLCFYLSLFPTISLSPLLSVYLSVSLSLSLSHFCLSCTHVSATIFLSPSLLPVFLSFSLSHHISLSPTPICATIFLSPPSCLCLYLSLSLPPFLCNHSCLRFCLHSYLSFSVWLSLSICLTFPSCISVYRSFFNPYLFFNLFSLCGSLPLMFLFLPRCLSFSMSHPCLSGYLSLSLFFHLLSLSSLYLSLSISLSLSLSLSVPFSSLYISIFLSFSLFLPHLSIFLSPIPVTLSFYVFSTPFSLFLSVSLFYHRCVSLYNSLSDLCPF